MTTRGWYWSVRALTENLLDYCQLGKTVKREEREEIKVKDRKREIENGRCGSYTRKKKYPSNESTGENDYHNNNNNNKTANWNDWTRPNEREKKSLSFFVLAVDHVVLSYKLIATFGVSLLIDDLFMNVCVWKGKCVSVWSRADNSCTSITSILTSHGNPGASDRGRRPLYLFLLSPRPQTTKQTSLHEVDSCLLLNIYMKKKFK